MYNNNTNCTEFSFEECKNVKTIDWWETTDLSNPVYRTQLVTPNGRPVEVVELACHSYLNDNKNTKIPGHIIVEDLYYTDYYPTNEELAEYYNPKPAKRQVEDDEDEEEKPCEKSELQCFAEEVYTFLKTNYTKFSKVAATLSQKKNSKANGKKDDVDGTGLEFNGDSDDYHVYGIPTSVAFLLQKAMMKLAPAPDKQKKLSEIRSVFDELVLREKRILHEIPLNETRLQNLCASEASLTEELSAAGIAVELNEDFDEIDELKSNLATVKKRIPEQKTKVARLCTELESVRRNKDELHDIIQQRMTGVTPKSIANNPDYKLVSRALKILNKCDRVSWNFLDHLHTYANSFCEETADEKFVSTIDETVFNIRPAKKKPAPAKVEVVPEVVVVIDAPKAEAPKAAPPKAEAPKAEAPKAAPPKAEAPKAEAPKAAAPKAAAPAKAPAKKASRLERLGRK